MRRERQDEKMRRNFEREKKKILWCFKKMYEFCIGFVA